MTDREVLPNLRQGETVEFEHLNHAYTGSAGYYDDGRMGEVFLRTSKTGTLLNITMHDSAIAASLALQYGCPVEVLRNALLHNEDGSVAGPLARLFELLAEKQNA